MTIENKDTEEINETDVREVYNVVVSFFSPDQATAQVAATSPEHAREIAAEMLAKRHDLEIIDVYPLGVVKLPESVEKAIKEMEEQLEDDEKVVN